MHSSEFKKLMRQEWAKEVLAPAVTVAEGEAFDILWELRRTLGLYFSFCGIIRPPIRVREVVQLAEKVGGNLSIVAVTLQSYRDGITHSAVFGLPTRCADLQPVEVSKLAMLYWCPRIMVGYVAKPLDLNALRRIRDVLLSRPQHTVLDLLDEGPRKSHTETLELLVRLIEDLPE